MSRGLLEGMFRDLTGVGFAISTVGRLDETKLLLKGEGATSSGGMVGYNLGADLLMSVAGDAGHTGRLASLPGLPMSKSKAVRKGARRGGVGT